MADPTVPQPTVPAPPAPATVALPGWVTALLLGSFTLSVSLVVAFGVFLYHQDHPAPPTKPYDAAFVTVGEEYARTLAPLHADALEAGADALDAGQSLAASLTVVQQQWETARQTSYDKTVTPALSKIVPEATKDTDVTAAQKAAYAKALRGLARGERK